MKAEHALATEAYTVDDEKGEDKIVVFGSRYF